MTICKTNNRLIQRILLFVFAVCFVPTVVHGANPQENTPVISDNLRAQVTSLNQVGNVTPQDLFGTALRAVFTVIGAIVLLVIVYGGIMLMTARGNSEQVSKAIKTLVWTALGTFVIFGGLALTRFVIRIFSGTTPGS